MPKFVKFDLTGDFCCRCGFLNLKTCVTKQMGPTTKEIAITFSNMSLKKRKDLFIARQISVLKTPQEAFL